MFTLQLSLNKILERIFVLQVNVECTNYVMFSLIIVIIGGSSCPQGSNKIALVKNLSKYREVFGTWQISRMERSKQIVKMLHLRYLIVL